MIATKTGEHQQVIKLFDWIFSGLVKADFHSESAAHIAQTMYNVCRDQYPVVKKQHQDPLYGISRSIHVHPRHDVLAGLFRWGNTKQGATYWRQIHKILHQSGV